MSVQFNKATYARILASSQSRQAMLEHPLFGFFFTPEDVTSKGFPDFDELVSTLAKQAPPTATTLLAKLSWITAELNAHPNFARAVELGATPIPVRPSVVERPMSNEEYGEIRLAKVIDESSDEEDDDEDAPIIPQEKNVSKQVHVDDNENDDFSFDDLEVVISTFPDLVKGYVPTLFSKYSADQLARTLIKLANNTGKSTASRPGTIIKDYDDINTFNAAFGNMFKTNQYHQILEQALLYTQQTVEAKSNYMSYDQFMSKFEDVIYRDNSYYPVAAGRKLLVNALPAVVLVPVGYSNPDVEQEYGLLAADLAVIMTRSGPKSTIVCDYCIKGKPSTLTFHVDPEVLKAVAGTTDDVAKAVSRHTVALHANGYRNIKGSLQVNTAKGMATRKVTLQKFIAEGSKSWVASGNHVELLKFWRSVRLGTCLDDAWMKHDSLLLKRDPDAINSSGSRVGGPVFMPYNSTAMKLVLGYHAFMPTIAKYTGKILVLYGGVTTNGKNAQLFAMRHLFESYLGPEKIDDAGNETEGKWLLRPFDLNGNVTFGTLSVNAKNLDSVLSLSTLCQKFDKVIVHLDLASGSVTEALNAEAGMFISNFLKLPNVKFVTSKYCVTGAIEVSGASAVVQMTDPVEGNHVGRSHGVEGIVLATRNVKKPTEIVRLQPFPDVKGRTSKELYERFLDAMHEGNMKRFSPKCFIDYSNLGMSVPGFFGRTVGAKVETCELDSSVVSVFSLDDIADDVPDTREHDADAKRSNKMHDLKSIRSTKLKELLSGCQNRTDEEIAKEVETFMAEAPRIPYNHKSKINDFEGLSSEQVSAYIDGSLPGPKHVKLHAKK